ncbi:MAG: vitamin K epoxide reductase family protein [Solirubrobacterales bacterium]|nr:vitamin K epoxide reductase family protein [Solirubrobacterales bacterium]
MTASVTNGVAADDGRSRYAAADRRLRVAIGVLCLIGIGIGTYLTYVHYAGIKVVCLSSGGCETVQSSVYSKLDGVPVAVLGLAGYVGILITLLIRGDLGRAAGFGLALVGFLFSMYLTYREVFTIKAICQWCVGSAVLMTLLAILTAIRVLRVESVTPAPKAVPRAERRRIERRQAARR